MEKGFSALETAINENENVFLDTNVVTENRLKNILRKIPREKKKMTSTSIEEVLTTHGRKDRFNTPNKKKLIRSYEVENPESEVYINMIKGLTNVNKGVLGFNDYFKDTESRSSKIYKEVASNLLYLMGFQTQSIDPSGNNVLDKMYDRFINVFNDVPEANEDTLVKFRTNSKEKKYLKGKLSRDTKYKFDLDNAKRTKSRSLFAKKESRFAEVHRTHNLTDYDILAQAIDQEGLVVTGDKDLQMSMDAFMENIKPREDNTDFKSFKIFNADKNVLKEYTVPVKFEYDVESLTKKLKKDFTTNTESNTRQLIVDMYDKETKKIIAGYQKNLNLHARFLPSQLEEGMSGEELYKQFLNNFYISATKDEDITQDQVKQMTDQEYEETVEQTSYLYEILFKGYKKEMSERDWVELGNKNLYNYAKLSEKRIQELVRKNVKYESIDEMFNEPAIKNRINHGMLIGHSFMEEVEFPKKHNGHNLVRDAIVGNTAVGTGLYLLARFGEIAYTLFGNPDAAADFFRENTFFIPFCAAGSVLSVNLVNFGFKRLKNLKNTFEDFKKQGVTAKEILQATMPGSRNNLHYKSNGFIDMYKLVK